MSVWVDGEGWRTCVSGMGATMWNVIDELEVNVTEFVRVNAGGSVNFLLKMEHWLLSCIIVGVESVKIVWLCGQLMVIVVLFAGEIIILF